MMQVVIHGTANQQEEFLNKGIQSGLVLETVASIQSFMDFPAADAFILFSFQNTAEEIKLLQELKGLVIMDSVTKTLAETDDSFIRFNGWPGFMETIIEASCLKEELKGNAEAVFKQFNKSVKWLADEPGFVTPRVISMIINEAYFALDEEVSSKEDIDLAMKLGTAYPFGPFEWGQKIGLKNVADLLSRLTKENDRYNPSALLVKEASG